MRRPLHRRVVRNRSWQQRQASADRLKRGTAWRELLAAAGRALAAAGLPDVGPRLATIGFLAEDGETATAAVLAAELARECGNAGDWANAAQAMLAEATARLEGGELEAAEQTLRSLIEVCDQRPDLDESLAVSAQVGLGDALLTLGQDERALEAYETAHRLAREAGRVDFEAEALLGRCEYKSARTG